MRMLNCVFSVISWNQKRRTQLSFRIIFFEVSFNKNNWACCNLTQSLHIPALSLDTSTRLIFSCSCIGDSWIFCVSRNCRSQLLKNGKYFLQHILLGLSCFKRRKQRKRRFRQLQIPILPVYLSPLIVFCSRAHMCVFVWKCWRQPLKNTLTHIEKKVWFFKLSLFFPFLRMFPAKNYSVENGFTTQKTSTVLMWSSKTS